MDSEAMPPADIEIRAGALFRIAYVGGRVVAVMWDRFVSNGSGAAAEWPDEGAAAMEFMQIAMAAADASGVDGGR